MGLVFSTEQGIKAGSVLSDPLWTSSSIKHREGEPSHSVPMGWTRYYEASDQHTVGAEKKEKKQLPQRYLLLALLKSPSLWLEVTRHRTRLLGRETMTGGCIHELWGEQSCLSLQPFILLPSACPRSVPTALALPE